MTENDRDEMIKVIYRYRSELPLTNRNLTRRVDMAQIANWPDDVLSSSYYYIIERLKSLAQFKAQTSSLDTFDDYFKNSPLVLYSAAGIWEKLAKLYFDLKNIVKND